MLLGDKGTCVKNLPKVVTGKPNSRESNHDPLSRKWRILTIRPPGGNGYDEDDAVSGAEPNAFLTSSSSIASMDRDIDEEIASLQLVINDLEAEIATMQQHFDGELQLAGNCLLDAVCIPPLDYDFAQRFTD